VPEVAAVPAVVVMVGAAKLLSENNAKVTLAMILLARIIYFFFLNLRILEFQ
jgi:hypothetical protein